MRGPNLLHPARCCPPLSAPSAGPRAARCASSSRPVPEGLLVELAPSLVWQRSLASVVLNSADCASAAPIRSTTSTSAAHPSPVSELVSRCTDQSAMQAAVLVYAAH